MKILIACEFSGRVRDAFIRRGHDAVSCDFLPCTYLCSSGLHWNKRVPGREEKTHEAMLFVFSLVDAPIERIAAENPIGCISTNYRKPDQIIQPWMFGEDASKSTCLWLKNLPPLEKTNVILPSYACKCGQRFPYANGKYGCPNECTAPAKQVYGNQTPSGQNKLGPSPTRWKERSMTYQGIADAMAEQWG